MTDEYNPLDYENLARNCADELLRHSLGPLPPDGKFTGAGVYALFYRGDFPAYEPIARSRTPIYVGKAVLSGGRKGGGRTRRPGLSTAPALSRRRRERAKSIDQAQNLRLKDFRCRFLVVTPVWITMAERLLIEKYRPVWNVTIEGFGIHDPGAGRHRGEISWWDALHPGRPFAARLRQTRDTDDALERLRKHEWTR